MNLALQAVEERNVGYALSLLDLYRPQAGQPDLRGWEWRYLWKLCRSDELLRLGSHSWGVNNAVFSPRGDVLATCSIDHTVRLWDMATHREIAVLPHEDGVYAAAFSADGNRLATACADGNVRRWNVATRNEISRVAVGIKGGPRPGMYAFSSGGEMFAFCKETGTVSFWDVVRGTRMGFLEAGGIPKCLAFSPNGKKLAVGYEETNANFHGVGLWDLGRRVKILLLTNGTVESRSLAFSPDGRTLAGGLADGTIKLWDVATAQVIRTLTGHSAWIPAMTFSPDGKMLASASTDHTAILWDVATGHNTTLHGHLNEVWAIAIAPDGRTVATGTKKDGIVRLWSTTPKPQEQTSQPLGKTLWGDRFGAGPLSPDGTAFLAVYADGTMGLWDTASLKETKHFPLRMADQIILPLSPEDLALSPLGKWVAIGEPDGVVRLVDTATGGEIMNFGLPGASVEGVAFSLDGSKLAVATADHKFRVWEIARKQVLSEMASSGKLSGFPSSFTFSADGLALCASYSEGMAEIFDTATGRRLGFLGGAKPTICGAVLLPDGTTAATGDFDQDVKLWDLKTQKKLVTLGGERLAYFAIALSLDGRRLAAGGSTVVRLWDPATRQQVALLKTPIPVGFGIRQLVFSVDGNTLVLEDEQRTLHTWRAPSWAEIEAAEKRQN